MPALLPAAPSSALPACSVEGSLRARAATGWPGLIAWAGLCALAWAAPAAAQGEAGPALERRWEVRLRERVVGEERVRERASAAGLEWEVEGSYRITDAPFSYRSRLRCEGVAALTSYSLDSAQVRAGAWASPEGVRYFAAYGAKAGEVKRGEGVTPKGSVAPFVVLDTLSFSHYEVLGRLARARDHAAFRFTLITPQANSSREASFEPLGSQTLAIGGAPREVRSGRIAAGQLRVELSYDAQSGRAYRVSDSQGYVAEVAEWPRPYLEEEVSIPRGAERIEGTFTRPSGSGPFPALLILPGSGPQDRDSSIGPNRPLRDLARALAAEGVASLRCDKAAYRLRRELTSGDRARVERARAAITSLDFEDEYQADALPALGWLDARPETRELVVCGHSLGAVAAAEVAAISSAVSGVILLAGPARHIDELLIEQTSFQLRRRGAAEQHVAASVAQIREVFAELRAGKIDPERNIMGAPARYWQDLLARPLTPEVLGRLPQPVLVIQGGNDCQIGPSDYEALEQALAKRPPETRHQALLFADLNHLFMKPEGQSTGEEYLVEGSVDPRVPSAIAAWIRRAFPRR